MTQDSDSHDANFLGLVYSLYQSAMIQMGKLADPTTGDARRDIRAARASIDLLDTLSVKTRGNLTEGEDKLIKNMLTELRLNFVGEVEKDERVEEKEGTVEEGPPADDAEKPPESEG
jgi:hypothetical protein